MTTVLNNATDAMTAKISTGVTYGTTVGTGILAYVGTSHFAVLTSFIIGMLAFLISTYLKLQDRKEKKLRHDLDVKERLARIAHLEKTSAYTPADLPVESVSIY